MVTTKAKIKTDTKGALAHSLGSTSRDLAFLDVLDEAAQQQLQTDIERAKAQHAESLRDAMEAALNQLPWLLRAPIRKLFGL